MVYDSDMNKDNKWLLASHMQKAIRRGLTQEAIWALEHLYNVDRSYMAYRLGVVMAEDVVAGGDFTLPTGTNPWGARYFDAKKNEDELKLWLELVTQMAESIKDSTPCEHIACVNYLTDFEKTQGKKWQDISIDEAIEGMTNTDKPWWWRGLMSWRAVGSKKYPSQGLPEVEGDPNAWLETCNEKDRFFIEKIGFKHIEPHVVFLPLARMYQREGGLLREEEAILSHGKSNMWLYCALDKHTREGGQALSLFIKQSSLQDLQKLKSCCDPFDALGRLYFWAEGGKHKRFLSYEASSVIKKDIRSRWLKTHNLNGRWFFDTWFDLPRMNRCRDYTVQASFGPQNDALKQKI